ncbi:hypothetical protein ACF0H5_009194 [Mactra antiquata]
MLIYECIMCGSQICNKPHPRYLLRITLALLYLLDQETGLVLSVSDHKVDGMTVWNENDDT